MVNKLKQTKKGVSRPTEIVIYAPKCNIFQYIAPICNDCICTVAQDYVVSSQDQIGAATKQGL